MNCTQISCQKTWQRKRVKCKNHQEQRFQTIIATVFTRSFRWLKNYYSVFSASELIQNTPSLEEPPSCISNNESKDMSHLTPAAVKP